tara:strand:+ start:1623 stop:2273 length:651 start_codon:yes stop_codon:yes gene_type:complete
MTYFRELPSVLYQSPLSTRSSSNEYVEVKNLFRRVKLRDDLKGSVTYLTNYYVRDGFRPDQVAEDLYGSSNLDWVVLHTAGIVNVRDEWPLTSKEIYDYSSNKYGNDLNQIRYYVTTEVKDSNGKVYLPKGKVVDSDFTIPDPTSSVATLNPVGGVTNYEHESNLNEDKRNITVLRPSYLELFLGDMRRIMRYSKSSQYVNNRIVKTENTRNTDPN